MQHRPVDQLDMDAAILHRLDGVGDLHQPSRGGFRIGEGAGLDDLIMPSQLIAPTSAPFDDRL